MFALTGSANRKFICDIVHIKQNRMSPGSLRSIMTPQTCQIAFSLRQNCSVGCLADTPDLSVVSKWLSLFECGASQRPASSNPYSWNLFGLSKALFCGNPPYLLQCRVQDREMYRGGCRNFWGLLPLTLTIVHSRQVCQFFLIQRNLCQFSVKQTCKF